MTGYAVRGHMGFVSKDGENFNYRLNVWLHREDAEQIDEAKAPDQSRADYVRAALREKLTRDANKGERR